MRVDVDVAQLVVDGSDAGRAFAVAVVLEATGSTPRGAGTRALIEADGSIRGTIGGGAVEAEAQRVGVEAIRTGRPTVFDFALEGADADDVRPICGGSMRVLADPTAGGQRAAWVQVAQARRERRRGLLLTVVRRSDPVRVDVLWAPHGGTPIDAAIADARTIAEIMSSGQPRLVGVRGPTGQAEPEEVLIEPVLPAPLLVIAGGGHVGQALAVQARLVGFDVAVIDDRAEFLDAARYPQGVLTRCGRIDGELGAWPLDGDTYVAIVTRGHQHDRAALAACVGRPAAYVGMIGSRRKVALIRRDLLASGQASEPQLDRVCAPIGLDIGAQTVPEIAASVVAELIAVRRTGRSPRRPIE